MLTHHLNHMLRKIERCNLALLQGQQNRNKLHYTTQEVIHSYNYRSYGNPLADRHTAVGTSKQTEWMENSICTPGECSESSLTRSKEGLGVCLHRCNHTQHSNLEARSSRLCVIQPAKRNKHHFVSWSANTNYRYDRKLHGKRANERWVQNCCVCTAAGSKTNPINYTPKMYSPRSSACSQRATETTVEDHHPLVNDLNVSLSLNSFPE